MMKTFGIVLLFALAGLSCDAPSDSPSAVSVVSTPTTAVSVPETAPEAPLRPDLRQSIPSPTTTLPDTLCAEWYPLAMEVGWPEAEWPTLSYVIHRESRCDPLAWNRDDPGTGSRGLTQVNSEPWCRKGRYVPHPAGYLGQLGVLETCDDLFEPRINLLGAYKIFLYGLEKHGYGWGPWSI